MKFLKAFDQMNEAHGVPPGLAETANKLYSMILDNFKKNAKMNFSIGLASPFECNYPTIKIEFNFELQTKSKIGDLEIPKVQITINLDVVKRPKKFPPILMGASFIPDVSLDDQEFRTKYSKDTCEITLSLEYPWDDGVRVLSDSEMKKYWAKKIAEFMENNEYNISSYVGHELMHFYDLSHIKGGVDFKTYAMYQGVQNTSLNIKVVANFFYYLYFLFGCESVVKRAEVASGMKAIGLTQDKFVNFLQDLRIYKTLKELATWKKSKFEQDLLDNIKDCRKVLSDADIRVDNLSDEKVVDKIKRLMVAKLASVTSLSLIQILEPDVDPFIMLLGYPIELSPDAEKYFQAFEKKLKVDMSDPDKFLENKEKFFNSEAKKLIKKLSGLYAMATEVGTHPLHAKITAKGQKPKNEGILNWDTFLDSIGIELEIKKNLGW